MMRTYRGIVCEKKNKYMVFLTREGEFLRGIPVEENADVGDEMNFHLLGSTSRRGTKFFFFGPAIVAAVLLLFMFVSLIPTSSKVMAYVQLETKSAVEFGVDKDGKVITIRHLNEETSLPENLKTNWTGQPIGTVLNEAIRELSTKTEDQGVAITTIFKDVRKKLETEEIVEHAVYNLRTTHRDLLVDVSRSTSEERKKANEQHMTIHKYNKIKQESSNSKKNMKRNLEKKQNTEEINEEKPKSNKQKERELPSNESGNKESKILEVNGEVKRNNGNGQNKNNEKENNSSKIPRNDNRNSEMFNNKSPEGKKHSSEKTNESGNRENKKLDKTEKHGKENGWNSKKQENNEGK